MEVWNKSNRFAQHYMRHVIPSAAGWQADAAETVWPRKEKKKKPQTSRAMKWAAHTRFCHCALNRRSAGDHFPLCSSKHRSVDKLILSVKSQRLSSPWPQVILVIVNVAFQLHLGRLYEPYFSGIVLKEMSSAFTGEVYFFFFKFQQLHATLLKHTPPLRSLWTFMVTVTARQQRRCQC